MNMPQRAGGRWWQPGSHFAWAASLFLAGLGAKYGLILAKGFSFPYHDQWQAEAAELFIPYLSGKFTLAMLVEPHNEHWIIFTRLLDLVLLQLNGQWDSLLEMACNAVIHCAGVAGFAWAMASLLGKRSWLVLWPVLALVLTLPFAWENTLWGFQSQFYFLFLFSWLTIWLLALSPAGSWKWWLGAATALAADFTMAPGVLASVTVVVITALAAWKERNWRQRVPTWIVCGVTIGVGLVLKLSLEADFTDNAHNLRDLLTALGKSLAWPWVSVPWYALVNLLPLALLGWVVFHSREPACRTEVERRRVKPGEWMIFGMAIWAGLQGLAAAYARGNGGPDPSSRYLDSLSFVGISGALAGWVLLNQRRPGPRMFPALAALLAGWAITGLVGLGVLTHRARTEAIPDNVAEHAAQLKASRAWVATGDARVFLAQPPDMRLQPIAAKLMADPHIRAVLPACVREPLAVTEATNIGNVFLRSANGKANVTWLSTGGQGTFESKAIAKSSLPYLEIPVRGDLGSEWAPLQLVDLKSGAVTYVVPSPLRGDEWKNVDVKAPSGEFKLVANKGIAGEGYAFQEPRELGRWSFWTMKWLGWWKWILGIGVVGFLLNLLAMVREGRSPGGTPHL
jgi:hypothetical protein